MAQSHRTPAIQQSKRSTTIAIHCSDPRYQPHFQHFLRQGLGLDRYALIAVPGGAQFLAPIDSLPNFSGVGWRWIDFMVELTQTERLILIAHDDCRWYLDQRLGGGSAALRDRMVDDLRRVRSGVNKRFGPRKIDLYFARLENDRASFEPV